MLLSKHKNYMMVGLSCLGVVVTVGTAFLGSKIDLVGDNTISQNQLAAYGIANVKTVANTAANGLQSESLSFDFTESNKSSKMVGETGFTALNNALKNSIEDEPTIFNVRGAGEVEDVAVEFVFESVSPSDYESKVFFQAYTPFTRLSDSADFSSVKYLSTIEDSGARQVTTAAESWKDDIAGLDIEDMWGTLLIVQAPLAENTAYNLKLALAENVTVHGAFSTEKEREQMMEADSNKNWDGILALKEPSVKNINVYMQGHSKSDNTVAVTIGKDVAVKEYVQNLTAYAEDEENDFPHDYTVMITVEGEAAPAHVFYPGK